MDRIAGEPYCGRDLEGRFAGVRSYRIGDWRILYEIHRRELLVLVIDIVKRSEAYR